MKRVVFFVFIIVAVVSISFKGTGERAKYIYLNAEQLKALGIELSKKGLFYQNYNPKWEADKEYPYLAFYSTKGNHVTSIISQSKRDFKNKEMTNCDFYPMLVGNPQNEYTFARVCKDKELVPIAVCMAEAKIPNRTDTLIFWFKPTDAFQKALPQGIKIEDYLRLPDMPSEG